MKSNDDSFRGFIKNVKASVDIADLIGKDVDLKAAGNVLTGLSPFQKEKHPSFTVWPSTQSWHDFAAGGGLGGDVFAYIQERDKVGFIEALYKLAELSQVRPPEQDEHAFEQQLSALAEEREIQRILTQSAAYYHSVLPSKIERSWCEHRYGFTEDTIESVQIGWGDGKLWTHLTHTLGIDPKRALQTGLFVDTPHGPKELFEARLVFPYWKRGQVVYFIARRTEFGSDDAWNQPKYKKLLTHSDRHKYVSKSIKNEHFYNEDAVLGAEQLLITEGVTDCISAMQAGIRCISPVTIRFRKQDVPKLLSLTRRAKRIIICNDVEGSGAGTEGALETAWALTDENRDVRVATLPRPEGVDKIDLNEFLKARSSEDFQGVLDSAKRYIEYRIEAIPKDVPKTDLSSLIEPVLRQLLLRPPIERDGYIGLIHKRFNVSRASLKSQLGAMQRASREANKKARQRARESAFNNGEGATRLRGEVFEDQDHYYIITPDGRREKISSFQIEPHRRIQLEDDEIIVGTVSTDRGTVHSNIRFPADAWRGKQQFHRFIKNADMQWSGTDNNLQGILRILSRRNAPISIGTKNLGYLETQNGPRWVAKDVILGPEGPVDESIVYAESGLELPRCVHYPIASENEQRELAQKILPGLLGLNKSSVVLPVLGWFFATPFKPRILKRLHHFPFLMVHGTAESGKTSLCKNIFWRLLGIKEGKEPFSVTGTEFPLIRLLSSTNSIPVFLDEYKPADMSHLRLNTLHRYLRRVYGGEVEERGRPDGSVISYHLAAPVCLAGEARPSDAALVDRMVAVSPDKNTIHNNSRYEATFARLSKYRLDYLAAPYIQFALGRNTEEDLELARTLTRNILSRIKNQKDASTRYKDNLLVVTLGLAMYEAFAAHMGVVDMPKYLDVEAAYSDSIEDAMDGDQGAKNALDLFLETCSTMAHNGVLKPDQHYAYIDNEFGIHLRSCWDLYLEYCRRTGQSPHCDSRAAIRRMLRENMQRGGYVKNFDRQVVLGEFRPRLVTIDLEKAKSTLDLDEFPNGRERAWGGNRFPTKHWSEVDDGE